MLIQVFTLLVLTLLGASGFYIPYYLTYGRRTIHLPDTAAEIKALLGDLRYTAKARLSKKARQHIRQVVFAKINEDIPG